MPYDIKKIKKGYKVCKRDNPEVCFSNKPLPYKRAVAQRKAIGMSGGGDYVNPDAELVKGLSGAVFDVAEMVPGFGTALSAVSPIIKSGLNFIIDELMYDPEIERRAEIKRDWEDYVREMSLLKYGKELTPEEYRYVNYELKKRRKAKLAREREEALQRDQKRAEEAGFKTIGEFSRSERQKGKEAVLEKVKKIGYNSVREYQQARKRGEVSPDERMIVEGRGRRVNKKLYREVNGFINGIMNGAGKPIDTVLYEQVKKEIYEKNPTHSLYRSAQIQKEYKKRGGKYEETGVKPMNIKKWFKQDWISLNDYVRGKIVQCGNSDTQKKYNEYPLCRPRAIADKLGEEKIKKMISEKTKIGKKPLITKDILGTEEFNIKPTMTGLGKDKFIKQLDKLKFPVESYLEVAKKVAKREGYDPKKLSLAMNNDNKLKYETPDGIRYFGKAGYGDYIIWLFKERNNQVRSGYADMKRRVFRKSHGAMSEKYDLDKFSPNELAINILW
jgi:hypothetical protein